MSNTHLAGGTVIDCTDGAARKNLSVLVASDRIAKSNPKWMKKGSKAAE
jgi:hypothetical protein